MNDPTNPFDDETWSQLPPILEQLPEPVHIAIWADETATTTEAEAARLVSALAARFAQISYQLQPRKENYPYYPVIGLMQGTADEWIDKGVRLIGLPQGVQLTSLLAGIQAVSFRGMTSEPVTRIKIRSLQMEVRLELITSAEDERGSIMAQNLFNLAVISPQIRAFLIMGDQFPTAVTRYSVRYVPHTVINGRVHIEGVYDEAAILKHIALAIKKQTG